MDPVAVLPLPLTNRSRTSRALAAAVAEPPRFLVDLDPGTEGTVLAVDLGGPMGARLAELGFTREAPVTLLRRAPFGGPIQVRLRDFVLSLRREQAARIRVRCAEGRAG